MTSILLLGSKVLKWASSKWTGLLASQYHKNATKREAAWAKEARLKKEHTALYQETKQSLAKLHGAMLKEVSAKRRKTNEKINRKQNDILLAMAEMDNF